MRTETSTLLARPGLVAEMDEHLRGSFPMRIAAVGVLRVLPTGGGRDGLLQALSDVEVQVRLEAVKALGALPDAAGRDGLLQALGDDDTSVREEAVRALTREMDAEAAWRWALVDADCGVGERLAIVAAIAPDEYAARLEATKRRHADADMRKGAGEVLAWIAHCAKLPVAGQAGEPDRSRDPTRPVGSAVDRSRDPSAASPPDAAPEATRRRNRRFWNR